MNGGVSGIWYKIRLVMESEERTASQKIADAVAATAMMARNSDAENTARLFDATERELLEELDCSNFELIEMKRRVAEAKSAHCFSKTGFAQIHEAIWARLESLGFSSFEREATMLMLLARHYLREGSNSEARTTLSRIETLISDAKATVDSLQLAVESIRAEAD